MADLVLRYEDWVAQRRALVDKLSGGRIGYVLFYNLTYYLQNPVDILKLWDGGMSFHGGLLGVLKGRSDPVHLRLMQRAVERALRLAGGGLSPGQFLRLLVAHHQHAGFAAADDRLLDIVGVDAVAGAEGDDEVGAHHPRPWRSQVAAPDRRIRR